MTDAAGRGSAVEPHSRVLLLDASALVEVLVPGRWSAAAERLLGQLDRPTPTMLLTASHALVEVTHALRCLSLGSAIPPAAASAAVDALLELDLVLDPPGRRLARAWDLRDAMTPYDALYAAAAEDLGLPLISTDERLIRACRAVEIPAIHLDDAFRATRHK